VHAGGLPDHHRRGQHTAAWDQQQGGSDPTDEFAQFGLEGVDLTVELVAADQQVAGEASDHAVEAVQLCPQPRDDAVTPQTT
jgi:hypothetical protein